MSKRTIIVVLSISIALIAGIFLITSPMFSKNKALSNSAGGQMDMLSTNAKAAMTDSYMDESISATSVEAANQTSTTDKGKGADKNLFVKKIIKNANISVQVKEINNDFEKINQWVNNNGGYEFSRQEDGYENSKNIRVVYKVPPEKLNKFIAFLSSVGKLNSTNISSNDITDDYYDTTARLQSLKTGRDQIMEIMKKAQNVDEILRVQAELNKITGDIEALEGRIKMWDKLVSESTVEISISEQNKPVPPSQEVTWNFSSPADVWKTMKNGFIFVTNMIFGTIVWILIALVTFIPIILLVGIGIIIFKLIMKYRNK